MKKSGIIFLCIVTIPLSSQVTAQRFFQKHSTWYEKIPSNPRLMSNSSKYIEEIQRVNNYIAVVSRDYGVPVWYASESTPIQAVVPYSEVTNSIIKNAVETNGWNKNVPIPPEAQPAVGYDGHMVIISHDRRYAWDFYQARRESDGTLSTSRIKRWDLTGDGIDQPYTWGGCRVAAVPLLHGLITYDEIQRGYINHALAFVTESAKRGSPGVYPSVTPNNGENDREWALWLGFRLQLDPDVDIESLGLNRIGKIIAKAMQEYGMIFVENGGLYNNSVFAEDLEHRKDISWESGIAGVLNGLPLNALRVVEPIYPQNNDLPTASITLNVPSPIKGGSVQLTLTTSKIVVNVPTPLIFVESDNSSTTIDLSGPAPGNIFTGMFVVDHTVADGPGHFSLPAEAMVDEYGKKGNEITSGAQVMINKTPPSPPQNVKVSIEGR
jgi:hypothetical protein